MRKQYVLTFMFVFILCTGCGKYKDKIVICTDSYSVNLVESAIEAWNEANSDDKSIEAEILVIPNDATAAEIKITEIRTEIMSGNGPDVFIIRNTFTLASDVERNDSLLFANPEKAMHSEIFLPLDSYLDEFESLDLEECNQAVLRAGKTTEGQMLLPLLYGYQVYTVSEGFEYETDMIYKAGPQGFVAYSGPYADYDKEELLVSKEDLIEQFEKCLYRDIEYREIQCKTINENFFREWISTDDFYAIPNKDGGVTANISVYGGINLNTRFAEEAASFLDSFCGVIKYAQKTSEQGIFIEQDEELQLKYRNEYFISEEDIEAFVKLNETVTDARFYSIWDYDLIDTYWSLRWQPEKSIEAAVDELYQKMQMQIKE